MADNVNISAGTGTAIAADEVVDGVLGTVKAQFVKVMDGTLDSTTKLGVYADDAAAPSNPTGNMSMAVRRDTLSTSEVSADGDVIALMATSKGKLHVAAETRFGDTVADTGSGTGGTATQRIIVDSSQLGTLGQAAMTASVPTALASDQTWGVGSVGFTKLEDAASADGDKGVPSLAVRRDSPSNSSGADGDYEFLSVKDGALWTRLTAGTTGGLTLASYLIASGTNATNVKASAGQIYKIEIFNNSANIGYLKIYNSASAPTAGSGTPVMRLMVPGSASGAGAISTTDLGLTFATGIGFTFTGGIADADTTSVAASAYIVNVYYK